MYTVSITSQGQISIPAKLRKKLGLNKNKKALVSEKDGEIIIKPVTDFLELGGSLHKKAIKGKNIQEIIKLEKEAVGNARVEHFKKSFE